MNDFFWDKLIEVINRLRVDSVTLLTARTNFFSSVPQRTIRKIVAIILIGDGVTSRTVNIEKTESDGTTHTMKFNTVPVGPAQVQHLPPSGYNILNPILTIEGGTNQNITGIVTGGSGVPVSVIYWDDVL